MNSILNKEDPGNVLGYHDKLKDFIPVKKISELSLGDIVLYIKTNNDRLLFGGSIAKIYDDFIFVVYRKLNLRRRIYFKTIKYIFRRKKKIDNLFTMLVDLDKDEKTIS